MQFPHVSLPSVNDGINGAGRLARHAATALLDHPLYSKAPDGSFDWKHDVQTGARGAQEDVLAFPHALNDFRKSPGLMTGVGAAMALPIPGKMFNLGPETKLLRASRMGDSTMNIQGASIPFSGATLSDERRALARQNAGDYLSNVTPHQRTQAIRDARKEMGVPVAYNLEHKGEHIGSVNYSIEPDKVYVHGIYVKPEHRGSVSHFKNLMQPVVEATEGGKRTIDGYVVNDRLRELAKRMMERGRIKGGPALKYSVTKQAGGQIQAFLDTLRGGDYPGAH